MYKNKYKKIAKEVILSEINSLKKLKASIDKNFYKVIETIVNCKKGKIILSGVGKSGIIAKKNPSNAIMDPKANSTFSITLFHFPLYNQRIQS